jgi:hypothetical protein
MTILFKLGLKIKRWWMRFSKKTMTLKDYMAKHRYDNKKKLINEIILVSASLNDAQAVVPKAYKEKLRDQGRKKLYNALMMLKMAETAKKLYGKGFNKLRPKEGTIILRDGNKYRVDEHGAMKRVWDDELKKQEA